MAHLVFNAIRTKNGTVLISRSRHDYKSYVDPIDGQYYMVDGGTDYIRRSICGEDLSLNSDDDHKVIRQWVEWGTYGPKGTDPLTYKPIRILSNTHLSNILDQYPDKGHLRCVFEDEIQFRIDNNIHIEDRL